MSSTEASPSQAALDRFIAEAERVGRNLREAGEPFFDVPPADPASYFVRRKSTPVTLASLEAPACADPAELERKLSAMWSARGPGGLAQLAPAAAALAAALREERKRQADSGDVTPFLYAMF